LYFYPAQFIWKFVARNVTVRLVFDARVQSCFQRGFLMDAAPSSDPIDLSKGPVSIALNRWQLAVASVFSVGLMVCFGHVVLSDVWSTFSRVTSFVGLATMIIVVPLITVQIMGLYVKKLPALSLTREGFINYLVSPTLVPWTDVTSCAVRNLGTSLFPARMLMVGLKPDALDHLLMPWFMRICYFHASAFFIGDDLDMPLYKLADVFERYSKAAALSA
jgi:hypothetical protein